jgi:uncharacterized protein YciI
MGYFVVTSAQGPAWDPKRSMREQDKWTEHAAFINSRLSANTIILGGPLGDGKIYRAMVIFNVDGEADVRAHLAIDPWYQAGVLRVLTIEPWNLIATNDRFDPILADISKRPV